MYLLNCLFMKGLFKCSSNHSSNYSFNYLYIHSSNGSFRCLFNHSSNGLFNGLFRCWFIYKIYIIKNI